MKGEHLELDIFREKVVRELGEALPKLPEGWRWVRLGDVCEINPSKRELASSNGELQVTFIPMSAVDEVTGTIQSPSVKCLEQVKKGYTYFREGDVLFAKITPCMENGKAAIAIDLVNELGFGSTEFHVIRPSKQITAEWVFHYIRQKSFRELAAKSMTGSVGQQRVPDDFLRSVKIPLPPLEEQKSIVARVEAILSRVEQANKLRAEALKDAEAIMESALHEVFSKAEEKGWEFGVLEEVAPIQAGGITELQPDQYYNYLSLENIEADTGKLIGFSQTLGGQIKSSKVAFTVNHILYGKLRPYLNKVYVADFNGICTTELVPLLPSQDRLLRGVLAWFMRSPRFVDYAMSNLTGTRMPRVAMRALRSARIPLPSLSEQKRIVTYLDKLQEKVEMLKRTQSKTKEELEAIIPTVLDRAFRGEL